MKTELINFIKYNKLFYKIYYHIGSALIAVLRPFIKINDKRVIFISFGGRKYDDSPKAIYEKMLMDEDMCNYEFIWAFINPEQHTITRGRKIKVDTPQYYTTLLSSRIWITNSGVQRGLRIPHKSSICINTWHGTPIKTMWRDISSNNTSFKGNGSSMDVDILLSQCTYEADTFSKALNLPKSKFAVIGYPRNDELVTRNNEDEILSIKTRLGIPYDKRVILYAPTFREYNKTKGNNCSFLIPLNFDKWAERLSDEYILLIRAHYEVTKNVNFANSDFVKNVSTYDHLNDLMLISDILISDYSSIFFDYSILERPMLAYCYDYDLYKETRGLYFDIREALDSNFTNEDELIYEIASLKYDHRVAIARNFKKRFIEHYGDASERCIKLIKSRL